MNRPFILLVVLLYALTSAAGVSEQSYGEKWRSYFVKAWSHSLSDRCLAMADTLYAEGEKHNDDLLLCRAMSVKANYFFFNPGKGDVINAADHLKKLGRKERRLCAYFYFASLYSVGYSLNHKQLIKAIREAHIVEQQAKKDNLKFGYHCMHIINSLIYAHNGEFDKALKQSEDAMHDAADNNDRYRAYQSMALCYKGMQVYDKALDILDRMYGYSVNDWQKFQAVYQKCMVLYLSGHHDEYLQSYEELQRLSKRLNNANSMYQHRARIYYLCCKGQFDEAMRIAVRQGNSFLSEQIEVMKAKGNYPRALSLFMKRLRYEDSLSCIYTYNDFAEIDREVGNLSAKMRLNSIQQKNIQTKTENTQLQTMNSELELLQLKASTKLMREKNINRSLKMKEDADELERLNNKNRIAKIKEDNAESEYLYHRNVLWIGIVLLTVVTVMVIIYLIYKRKIEKIINKKNKELAKAYQMAEESQLRKRAFLKSISHEIRTPINAIMGFTEVLTTPGLMLDDGELDDLKMRIRTNSQHLQTLVRDILDTKGLETGKISVKNEPVRVNDVCRSAMAFIKERCDVKGLKQYFVTDVDDDYTINTDSQRLQQVLINYLTNAEKNTAEGYIRLSFSTVERKGWLVFSVEDTGCGVPADKADMIFNRFEKVNEFVQGAGMGLYMCRIIAKRLNGRAELDRMYQGGARFLFAVKQFVVMLLMLISTTAAMAQLNSSPALVALHDKTKQMLSSPQCLTMADSLYSLAEKQNDHDMQCLAIYVHISYYQRRGDYDDMTKHCNRMMECAQKYNLSHHYYLAWYTRINYLFQQSRSAEALRQLNVMREQAVREKNIYGQARCYRAVGNIYLRKGSYSIALKNFEDELHTIEHANTRQDLGDVYQKIGSCQKYLGQYKLAARTFDKAIRLSRFQRVTDENKAWRAIVAFMLDDRDLFTRYYDELSADSLAMQTMNGVIINQLHMFHCIMLNQWAKALEICYSTNPASMRYMLLSDYYYFQGDSYKALEMKERRQAEEWRGAVEVQREDVAQYLSQMTKDQMEVEKVRLEQENRLLSINNEQLNLSKLTLQLENARDIRSIERTRENNGKLAFKAQRHKIEHAKAQAKIKQQEEELDMARHKRSLRIMLTAGVALLVILLMISYVVYRRRGNVKILREKNHRLKEELEKVNRSNRTKEEFLVQMSHEVNQPLNAILGFTELLLRDTYKDDEKGRMDARKIVEDSTQQLLGIVTDAVEKAMK